MPVGEVPRPFLKWAGGKGQLLPELVSLIPSRWSDGKLLRYHEPFLGGGAFFLELWRLSQGKIEAYLDDANLELMNAWTLVLSEPERVMAVLDEWPSDERTYYRIRTMDPWHVNSSVVAAARTIYLNKNGYNGLYRLAPDFFDENVPKFNVPWGKRPGTKAYDRANLLAFKEVGASLWAGDFRDAARIEPGDLVYFDPPYLPIKPTSMTDYGPGKFGQKDHEDLACLFDALVDRGAYCMLSNVDLPWVRERYHRHRVHSVVANRAINRDGKGRTGAEEVIVVGFRG